MKCGKAVHESSHKSVFQRLRESNVIAPQGTGAGRARRGGPNTEHRIVTNACAGDEVVDGTTPLFEIAGLRVQGGNRAGQLSILGIIRIRNHLNRSHNIDRYGKSWTASRGVGCIDAVYEQSTMRVPGAFHVDAAVWPTHDSRKRWQNALSTVIDVR